MKRRKQKYWNTRNRMRKKRRINEIKERKRNKLGKERRKESGEKRENIRAEKEIKGDRKKR